MKLVSLNVALFETNNSKLNKFLQKPRADIICLQEVVREIEKLPSPDYISKNPIDIATPELKYSFFGPNSIMDHFEMKDFHNQDDFHFDLGGLAEMGNYLKSKYKIIKAQNIFVQNHFTYTTYRSKWPDEDYRAVLVADLDINGKQLRVLNYHGIWTRDKMGNEKSMLACKKIKDLALEATGEVIICGDFNLFPDTISMKIFETNFISLVDKFKIKTTRPSTNELSNLNRNVVDYIWISKGINVKSFKVLESDVSDHLPLIVEFDI